MTFRVGEQFRILPTHPHGPSLVEVVRIETVMGEERPVCKHVRPHDCMQGTCETEFFVMSGRDILGGHR